LLLIEAVKDFTVFLDQFRVDLGLQLHRGLLFNFG
jgi:hypothetical protein